MSDGSNNAAAVMEAIQSVAGPMGGAGAAFYFHPDTLAKGKELGLDGFRWYILGRGGVLGDVSASMVHSAFGYFHPALIDKIWNSAKETLDPKVAGEKYLACAADLGRKKLAEVEDLDQYCAAAETVISAADPSALTLFAGMVTMEAPDDLPGRAMHQTAVLRELRGSVHLLAVVGSDLDPAVAHAIRRPDDVATFGHRDEPTVTEADRAALAQADDLTDQLLLRPYGALDQNGLNAIVDGAAAVANALA